MPPKRGKSPIDPKSVDAGAQGDRIARRKTPHKQRKHAPPRVDDAAPSGGTKDKHRRHADVAARPDRSPLPTKAQRRARSRWVVNLPFTVLSLASVVLLTGGALLLHTERMRQLRAFSLSQATEAEESGKWRDVAEALRDYLRLSPYDAEARARLATAADRAAANFQEKYRAAACYDYAIGVLPDRVDLRQRLATLLVELRSFPFAEKDAEWLLDHDRNDPVGRQVMAACQYERWRLDGKPVGDTAKVIDLYNRALDVNKGDIPLSTRLADIYWDEMQLSTEAVREGVADGIMKDMIELNPKRADALLARYRYRHKHHLPDKDRDLTHALELAPNDANVLVAAGTRANEQEHYREGRDFFARVVQLAPQDRRGYDGVGDSYRGEGDLPRAADAWGQGLLYAGADDIDLNAKIAEAQIELGQLDKAEESVSRLARVARSLTPSVPRNSRAARIRGLVAQLGAKLALKSGDLIKAVDRLQSAMAAQKLDSDNEEDLGEQFQSWMRLGWTYGLLGQWDLAAKQFEAAVAVMPRDPEARTALAGAWRSAGRLTPAIQQFARALDLNPGNTVVRIHLAECELQQQLNAPADHRDWEPFRKLLAEVKQQSPDTVRLEVLEAAFEETMGRSERAIQSLEKAAAANPSSLRVAQTLIRAYQRAGDERAADRVVANYEKALGRPPWLLRAELRFQRQQPEEAKQVLRAAIAAAPDSAQRLAAIQRLDQSGVDAGERDRLRKLLADEADRTAGPQLQVVQQLAEFALEAQDSVDLNHWATALRRLEGPSGSLWRYYRARRLLIETAASDGPAFVEATELQTELEGLRPFWPDTCLLKGLIAQRHGQMERAADAYQRAIELGENHLATFESLIAILYHQNRFVDADHFLQQLGRFVANSQSLSAVALAMTTKHGQVERTLDLALEGVRKRPHDAMATVWLAQAQQLAGKPEEATVSFYRAVKMAPKDARTWTALAAFHAARKERQPAREAVEGLAKNVGFTGGMRSFVVAQGYELIGDRDQAELNYREAVRQSPEDLVIQSHAATYFLPSHPGTAEVCLRRILAVAAHDASTRQKLAMILVARGGQQNLEEAEKLLSDQLPEGPAPLLARRLQTMLLLRRGDASSRQRAQAILESLVREADEPSADDRLILATLYEEQGRLAAAREQLTTLANRREPVPGHLAAYVAYLLRHAAAKEAELPLSRLEQLEPDNFRTVILRARLLSQQRQAAAVEPLVEGFARKHGPKAGDVVGRAMLLKRIADLYAELGLAAAAERSYRQLAALTPEGQKPLALWLAAAGRRADAIRDCRDAAAAGKSPEAAVALCAVLMDEKASGNDSSTVDEILAASLREHPNDERLLFHLATLRCAQGRTADAIDLYRKLLAINPRHVPALNNLANLLADDPAGGAEAQARIQRAIEIAGATAELLDTQAVVWMSQGKLPEAIKTLRELTAGPKADPRHHFHLALACHRDGAETEAQAALKQAESGGLGHQVLTPAERAQWVKLQVFYAGKHAEGGAARGQGGRMNRYGWWISVVLGAGLTVAGAVIEGSYSYRWTTPGALAAAGERLQDVPQVIGPWQAQEDPKPWDAKTVEMLECSGYIHRTYVNRKTGQMVNVAVLVGPPGPTSVHIPEICYSSAGYEIKGPSERFAGPPRGAEADEFWGVTFRSLDLRVGVLQVGYGWSVGGSWTAPDHPRINFAGHQLLYKLQLSVPRPARANIRNYDACRDFLADFLPVLQQSLMRPSSP